MSSKFFETDGDRRLVKRAEQDALRAEEERAQRLHVQNAKPVFEPVIPKAIEVLQDFAVARELHQVSVEITDLSVMLKGQAVRWTDTYDFRITLEVDLESLAWLKFRKPSAYMVCTKDDLEVLAQVLANQIGMRVAITGYDGGHITYEGSI